MNKPNQFRVAYRMSGQALTRTVENIADIYGMQQVQSVTPLYVEEFPDLTEKEINDAIQAEFAKEELKKKQEVVKECEDALNTARAELNEMER